MSKIVVVCVNCASRQEASHIAEQVLEQRLAASANLYPEITSSYWWNGRIESRSEHPLVLKTTDGLVAELADMVEGLHSYDTAGIVAVPAEYVNARYDAWLRAEVGSDAGNNP